LPAIGAEAPRAVSSAFDYDGPGDLRVLDRREADEPRIDDDRSDRILLRAAGNL